VGLKLPLLKPQGAALFTKIFYSLVFILLPLSGANSFAQEVSPEKKELIRELLVVTQATKNAAAIMDSMSDQVQKDMLRMMNQVSASDRSLTDAQRAEKERLVAESAKRAADRFKELFKQRVNYSQLVEDVSYEVYDKYYTADELRDLIAFYKSATGQKSIKIMAQVFAESMAKTSQRLMPAIQPLMQEIIDEELKRIERTLPVNKVPPGRRTRSRADAQRRSPSAAG
jgi:hypothetical protein